MITLSGNQDMPCFSPDGSKLAFFSDHTGNGDIYIYDLKAKELIRITNSDDYEAEPAWSPDGSRIAYFALKGGKGNIWLFDFRTGRHSQITDGKWDEYPTWSPDGTCIAYFSRLGDGVAIVKKNLITGQTEVLYKSKKGLLFAPSWSPDGKSILFCYNEEGNFDIWKLDLNSGNATRLTKSPYDELFPCWSPNGEFIAFNSNSSGTTQIWMGRPGGRYRQLTYHNFPCFKPTWTDGKIAFTVEGKDRDIGYTEVGE